MHVDVGVHAVPVHLLHQAGVPQSKSPVYPQKFAVPHHERHEARLSYRSY